MNNTPPTVLETTSLLNTFFSVRKERLQYANNTMGDYYILQTAKESVAIIATTKDNKILTTREYRHAAGKVLLGCPGGSVDPGESFLKAAERELLEETGYTASHFSLIGTTYPLPGVLEQKMAVIHAHDVVITQQPSLQEQEIIESKLLPLEQIKQAILSGGDVDAIFCTALLFYLVHNQ